MHVQGLGLDLLSEEVNIEDSAPELPEQQSTNLKPTLPS